MKRLLLPVMCGWSAVGGVSLSAPPSPEDMARIWENVTTENRCQWGVDLLFLQDTTGSFYDDMPYTRAQLPRLIELLNTMFPGSRTGVAEFRDKPYFPLGEKDDFCYKHHQYGSLTRVSSATEWAYSILQPSGGGDEPEDQYQAIINSILDDSINWRPVLNSTDPLSEKIRQKTALNQQTESSRISQQNVGQQFLETAVDFFSSTVYPTIDPPLLPGDEVAARIIVILTDATVHYNGQMSALYPPDRYPPPVYDVPQNLPPNNGTVVDGDPEWACLNFDYSSPDVFKEVVLSNNIKLIQLHTENVTGVWEWINDDLLGQPSNYRQLVDELSTNFLPQLIEAMKYVAIDASCPPLLPTVGPYTTTSSGGEETGASLVSSSSSAAGPTATNIAEPTPCPNNNGDGVLIRLKERPRHMILEVFNDDVPAV